MNKQIQCSLAIFVTLTAMLLGTNQGVGCTGIRLEATDGTVVYARTLEFGLDLDSSVLIVPRGLALMGTAPSGKPGLAWNAKYAAVGLNAQGQPILVDGVNEKGLAGGLFYFPGYAQYQEVLPTEESQSLGQWELMTWILTNFGTVAEVRAALADIKVSNALPPGWQVAPPAHYVVHDAAGKSLVIEYIAGKLNLNDNPIGVITNSPEFTWHVKNLSNYVNLSPINQAPVEFDGLNISQFGQGSGLLGIPGDFTPPSRFVRAALLSRSALPGGDGPAAVAQAFHVLDSFDIPRGDIRDNSEKESTWELTQWTCASDTRNCTFYFHTHDNRRVRRVDLLNAELNAKTYVTISRHDGEDVQVLTLPTGAGN